MITTDIEPIADKKLTALRACCGPYLARLAVLAGSPPGTPLPPGAAAEVAEATRAVLAQAGRVMPAAATGRPAATGEFLLALLARLEAAADGAVTAARSGYAATLRAYLRQFDALASALWAVHEAVAFPPPQSPPPGRHHPACANPAGAVRPE